MASDPGKIKLEPDYKTFFEDAKKRIITSYDGNDDHPMHDPFWIAWSASKTNLPVLLSGETGTGKQLFAELIHHNSNRKNKPLVTLDCGGQTESLLHSELFGHVKGAFTGATENKDGLFKLADGGTIFIDEIGSAPSSVQDAILRVIESGEMRQVGSSKSEKINARVISATNIDLQTACTQGKFREDLRYRLVGLTVNIPPLFERGNDIFHLIAAFWLDAKKDTNAFRYISFNAMALLIDYVWKGNVRELQHVVRSCVAICRNDVLQYGELAKHFRGEFDEESVRESWRETAKYLRWRPALKVFAQPEQEDYLVLHRRDLWSEHGSLMVADFRVIWNDRDWSCPSKFFADYPEVEEFIDTAPKAGQRFTFEEADQQLRFDMHKLCESVGMDFELQRLRIRQNGRPKRGGGKLPPHAQQAIIQSYEEHKNISKVHDELGYDPKTIRKYLCQHDILPSD